MQRQAFVVREVIAFVVHDQIQRGAFGQCGRLVEHKPTFQDACLV